MSNKKLWIGIIALFFLAGSFGGYLFLSKFGTPGKKGTAQSDASPDQSDLSVLRIYYPVDGRLEPVEKSLPRRTRQMAIAEAVIEEFFKGPGGGKTSCIPQNVKLLGLYRDQDHILYVDISDDARRNFQGDALAEYLLLKGLYESIVANIQDIQDVKILMEGKEAETLGGHLFLKYTLKTIALYDFKGDTKISNE